MTSPIDFAAIKPPAVKPIAVEFAERQQGENDAGAHESPTADEPLRGLRYLGPIAVVGGARLLELARTPVRYVWQDIAVLGTVIMIAGPPAEGKTTLLFLVLAARMNTGGPVSLLARQIEPAPKGQWIVLIEGEHGESSTARKLVRSLDLLGIDHAALDRVIVVARKAVRLGSPEWADVTRLVQAGLVSDIAIDTVARVAPADANSEKEQVAIFDAVAQTIETAPSEAAKPIVWTVAHTRKNDTTGGLGDVSGSVQRTGQADSVLLIKGEKAKGRTVSTTVTFAKLREDPEEYPEPVTFSIAAGANGGPRVLVSSASDDDDERPLEPRVLEQLHLGPRTKNQLRDALGRNGAHIEEALSNLFAARRIATTEIKVRGKSVKAFALREDGQNLAGLWPDSLD